MRVCTVCKHASRSEIDKAFARSESLRTLAAQFGTSKSALIRHKAKCISRYVAKAQELGAVESATALVKKLQELTRFTRQCLASKLAPKEYGDKIAAEVSGPIVGRSRRG